MNDARQTFVMFCPDFCHPAYRAHPLYEKMVTAFEPPMKGDLARQAVLRSKAMLGVITAFAGQWPHATYMAPGGVTCEITAEKLANEAARKEQELARAMAQEAQLAERNATEVNKATEKKAADLAVRVKELEAEIAELKKPTDGR